MGFQNTVFSLLSINPVTEFILRWYLIYWEAFLTFLNEVSALVSNSGRCDFACINVPVHEVVTQEGVLSPPPVNLGTSNVDDLFQKLRHPKSKEKRSENNSRLVVGSLKYLINANICTVYSWTRLCEWRDAYYSHLVLTDVPYFLS